MTERKKKPKLVDTLAEEVAPDERLLQWLDDFVAKYDSKETAHRLTYRLQKVLHSDADRLRAIAARFRSLLEAPPKHERRRLPEERHGKTRRFKIPHTDPDGRQTHLKVYVSTGCYPDGALGEVFVRADKVGSLASGAFDALAMAVSIGLQYGVPLEAYTSKLIGMRFEPAGWTGDDKYPICSSAFDLLGRWLRDEFAKEEP